MWLFIYKQVTRNGAMGSERSKVFRISEDVWTVLKRMSSLRDVINIPATTIRASSDHD